MEPHAESFEHLGLPCGGSCHHGEKVIVAESLSVDTARTTVPPLISALFYDLSREKEVRIPAQGERRERELRKLVECAGKPVALFIDEAHDLHSRTLSGLKRLMEVISRGASNLSVVLIGHRTDVLIFDGLGDETRAYLDWLIQECITDDTDIGSVITPEALNLIAEHMRTPLQFAECLNRSFEGGHLIGQKPITAEIVQSVLLPDFDDLEPRLTRQGDSVKSLSEQFHTRPAKCAASSTASSNRAKPARSHTHRRHHHLTGRPSRTSVS